MTGPTFNGRKSDDPAWAVTAFRSRPLAEPSLQKVFFAHAKELPNWKVAAKVRCEGSEKGKKRSPTPADFLDQNDAAPNGRKKIYWVCKKYCRNSSA